MATHDDTEHRAPTETVLDTFQAQDSLPVLKQIINNIPYAIFWKDRDCVYLGCNEQFARTAGLSGADQIRGKTDFDLAWKPEESEHYRTTDRRVMEHGQPVLNLVEPQFTSDGHATIALTSKVPLRDAEGKVSGILGIYADITEQKKTEKELREAKNRAETASRTKSEFLANVSHELRTPLTLILGSLDSLTQRLDGPASTPSMLGGDLERIRRNSLRLLQQVNDILDLSALEAGHHPLQKRGVDLAHSAQAVVNDALPVARANNQTLTFNGPASALIEADPRKIDKIIVNLVGNALKFTPPEGQIEVRLVADGADFELSVIDTGPGIPKEQHHAIFERFEQADSSSTRRHEGTGIGLALVRELTELQGGQYGLQSEPGHGSRFWVRFEVAAGGTTATPSVIDETQRLSLMLNPTPLDATAPTSTVKGRTRILVVEDNCELRDYICSQLAEHYEVSRASDGRQALDMVEADPPDLILSDQMMPRLDGLGLIKALKQNPAHRHIPIILLTARASDASIVSGLDSGADDYLTKPFSVHELLARVRVALRLGDMSHQLAMRDRLATLGTLSAGVAHEINNPLAAILSNLAYVTQQFERPIRSVREQHEVSLALEQSIEGVTQISKIVDDLGTFTARGSEDTEPVDLHALLTSVANLATNELRNRATLSWDLQPIPRIMGYRARLGQVFLNLIINAAHSFPRGQSTQGQIRITTRPDSNDRVTVSIKDSGHGIAPDMLERIFDPFFTTKSVGEGTGLGLWVSRRIIDELGGEIRVRSTPNVGTTFDVVLPIGRYHNRAVPDADAPLPNAQARVLIIDDDKLVAHAIRRSLPNCDVTIALGGRSGLEYLLSDSEYEMVLCDLMMPDLTGEGVYEQIEQSCPHRLPRIVFMTGSAYIDEARAFFEQIPNYKIYKPFSSKQVTEILLELKAANDDPKTSKHRSSPHHL